MAVAALVRLLVDKDIASPEEVESMVRQLDDDAEAEVAPVAPAPLRSTRRRRDRQASQEARR